MISDVLDTNHTHTLVLNLFISWCHASRDYLHLEYAIYVMIMRKLALTEMICVLAGSYVTNKMRPTLSPLGAKFDEEFVIKRL